MNTVVYIALLRGINISGKNKISMPELKTAIGEKGFADVKTYLNIGNVRPFATARLENRLNFLWRDNYDE